MLFAVDVDVVVTWSLEAPGFNSHIGQSKINNINYYLVYNLQYKNWKIKLPTNPGQTGMGFSWVKKPTHTHIQDYPTHQPMAIPTFTSWSPLASPILFLSLMLLPTFSDAIDRILKWRGANWDIWRQYIEHILEPGWSKHKAFLVPQIYHTLQPSNLHQKSIPCK